MRNVIIHLGSPCIAMHRLIATELGEIDTSYRLLELNAAIENDITLGYTLAQLRQIVVKAARDLWGDKIVSTRYTVRIIETYSDALWLGIRNYYSYDDIERIIGLGIVGKDYVTVLDDFN